MEAGLLLTCRQGWVGGACPKAQGPRGRFLLDRPSSAGSSVVEEKSGISHGPLVLQSFNSNGFPVWEDCV